MTSIDFAAFWWIKADTFFAGFDGLRLILWSFASHKMQNWGKKLEINPGSAFFDTKSYHLFCWKKRGKKETKIFFGNIFENKSIEWLLRYKVLSRFPLEKLLRKLSPRTTFYSLYLLNNHWDKEKNDFLISEDKLNWAKLISQILNLVEKYRITT